MNKRKRLCSRAQTSIEFTGAFMIVLLIMGGYGILAGTQNIQSTYRIDMARTTITAQRIAQFIESYLYAYRGLAIRAAIDEIVGGGGIEEVWADPREGTRSITVAGVPWLRVVLLNQATRGPFKSPAGLIIAHEEPTFVKNFSLRVLVGRIDVIFTDFWGDTAKTRGYWKNIPNYEHFLRDRDAKNPVEGARWW